VLRRIKHLQLARRPLDLQETGEDGVRLRAMPHKKKEKVLVGFFVKERRRGKNEKCLLGIEKKG